VRGGRSNRACRLAIKLVKATKDLLRRALTGDSLAAGDRDRGRDEAQLALTLRRQPRQELVEQQGAPELQQFETARQVTRATRTAGVPPAMPPPKPFPACGGGKGGGRPGWPWSLRRRAIRIEQHQQLQFAFAGAPADDRGRQVARPALQITVALLQCDDRPAHIGKDLPEAHALRIEPAARGALVAGIKRRAVGDAARLAVEPGKAPALAAEPADVLVRVAPTGEF